MPPDPAIDHLAVVKAVKATYQMMPPSAARGWTITNEVARRLQALGEDAGLLGKTSGTNYNGYSLDRICYRSGGELYDCLMDAEGEARPDWRYEGLVDVSLWRPPVPVDPPEPPDPPDPPDPPEPPVPPDDEDQWDAVLARLDVLIAETQAQTQVLQEIRAVLSGPLQVQQPVTVKVRW